MRAVLVVILQIVIAWLVAGALIPPILMAVPAARGPRAGVALTLAMLAGVFVLLRVLWPKPKRG